MRKPLTIAMAFIVIMTGCQEVEDYAYEYDGGLRFNISPDTSNVTDDTYSYILYVETTEIFGSSPSHLVIETEFEKAEVTIHILDVDVSEAFYFVLGPATSEIELLFSNKDLPKFKFKNGEFTDEYFVDATGDTLVVAVVNSNFTEHFLRWWK